MRSFTLTVLAMGAVAGVAAMEQFIPGKEVTIHPAVESKAVQQGSIESPPLSSMAPPPPPPARAGAGRGAGRAGRGNAAPTFPPPPPAPEIKSVAAGIEQKAQGKRAAIPAIAGFDGLGEGFTGRLFPGASQDENAGGRGGAGRGGIDISLAVGPDHIFEILGGNMAVFTKKGKKYDTTGKLLYGAVPNDTVFAGMGVRCGVTNNSDTVVRYDQLADRWLIVLPVFSRPPGNPEGPYAMCYAVSKTSDPLGPYYR